MEISNREKTSVKPGSTKIAMRTPLKTPLSTLTRTVLNVIGRQTADCSKAADLSRLKLLYFIIHPALNADEIKKVEAWLKAIGYAPGDSWVGAGDFAGVIEIGGEVVTTTICLKPGWEEEMKRGNLVIVSNPEKPRVWTVKRLKAAAKAVSGL
jgi:hypothetical protein